MYRYTLPTTSLSQEISDAHAIFSGHTSSITDFAILPDNRIASASYDHTIKLWDLAAGNCERTLTEHTECVWALVMLSNGMLASGSGDKLIKLWNPMTGICTITLYETAQVLALTQISEDLLASGCWDKSVKIWNFVTQRCMKRLEEHQGSVWALTPISKDFLASGSYDSSIKIWNLKNENDQTLLGHSGYVVALTRLTENKLASGSHDKSIKIWNLKTGLCEQTLLGHLGPVTALALLLDAYLASGSHDKSIKLWNLITGLCDHTIMGHANGVTALLLLENRRLVSASTDAFIKIWDIEPAFALATTTVNAEERIKSNTILLKNEVTMKDYTELGQLFVQHGRPTDYHAFLEHPDVQDLKTQLGKKLASIFLCLLHHHCKVSDAFLQRLVRYKEEKRLRDLEVAMLELVKSGFELTVTLLDDMCAKAGRDSTFLLSVRLMHMAKQAGFFNNEHNQIPEEIFTLLKTSKVTLYEKLLEKSALDIHVLKNASTSDMPKSTKDLEACVDIYYYATLCGCTALLNYPSEHKMSVLSITSKYENSHLASILKKLHETHRLTKESFLLTCNVSMSASYLLPTLSLLENAAIDLAFFCRCILDRKKDFRKMQELHEILDIIQRGNLMVIDEEHVQTFILLTDNLSIVLESLYYLEQRAALTRDSFLWVMCYYENNSLKQSTSLSSKKAHSMLSPGLFSSRNTEKTPTIEISAMLFALSETHLLEQTLEDMSLLFTLSGVDFIQQLFQLNELNQHAIDLARKVDFEKNALENIVTLASYHRGLPEELPAAHASEFLACLVVLAPLAPPLPALIQAFAFNHAPLLKRLLTLLMTEQALTIEAITVFIEECQRTEEPATFLQEKVFCRLLGWPMTAAESLATCNASSTVLFKALQSLQQNTPIDLSPNAEHAFILPGLYQSADPIMDAEIIKGLFAAHALHRDTWELVRVLNASQKRFLIPAIQRLAQHDQCNYASLSLIFSAKNQAVALQLFLLLTTEDLSIAVYWNALMQHAHPLLLCQGLIELNTQGLLTADYFSKIAEAKQPFLGAKALAQLLQAGIPLASCWSAIADTENPEGHAQLAMSSATPGKLNEDLPVELRQAITHHAQPKLARQYLTLLQPISAVTTAQLLRILPLEEASAIIQALVQLNELTFINDALIELMIENVQMLAPLKKYFALPSPSATLFTQLCQANSVKDAENLIKREEIMAQLMVEHPQVAALLQEIFSVSSSHQHQWTTALALLQSVDEVNAISIGYCQQTTAPEKRAIAIVALKKAGLYTAVYLNRAIRRENQAPGVYSALRYLAENGELNEALFNFVIINSEHQTLQAAEILLKMPGVQRAHLNWLATYTPRDDYRNAAVDMIHKLDDLHCLNRFWIEKIMQQKAPSLDDVACYVYDLPSALLDEVTLKKIFAYAGNCYFSADEEEAEKYHPPFHAFRKDPSLLTKEVLDLLFMQSGYQYAAETIFTNMAALKQAALFHPEIVACCTTKERTQAIIALSKAQQWNEINKAIVLASPDPQADAELILCLVQQNKYSHTTANLLLLRLQLNQSNAYSKECAGNYSYYFSKLLKQILLEQTDVQESTVQYLLNIDVKWKTIKTILDTMEDDVISDTQLCVIASTDQIYLSEYVNYIEACCHGEMKISEVLKLQEYESLLNHPALLAVIKKTVSKEERKKALNIDAMQQLLNDLWPLCATGDQAAINARILSPTESTATSTLSYRP